MNSKPKILIIDNYDSFTHNLVQIVREHQMIKYDILLNDRIDISLVGSYDGYLISPGPGVPSETPALKDLIEKYGKTRSILGICLGFQTIAEFYGMNLERLGTVKHGIEGNLMITDPTDYIFKGLPVEFTAGLYHSWAVKLNSPGAEENRDLNITAVSDDGIVMAVSHKEYDIKGVQFHPESYISPDARKVVENWLDHLIGINDISEII
jgi:anthranilate synthase component 2